MMEHIFILILHWLKNTVYGPFLGVSLGECLAACKAESTFMGTTLSEGRTIEL